MLMNSGNFNKTSFKTASKIINYVGINLPKEVKNLYCENNKTPMKETEGNTNKWKDFPCSWFDRTLLKWPTAQS